ncbi:WD40/YVTN/BNR-like repeat-containing protein [Patescibacteria group bacterium]
MRRIISYAAVLAFLCVLPLSAQAYSAAHTIFSSLAFEQDTQTGASRTNVNLFGGYVEDIEVDSSGRVYAASNSPNGIHVSVDGGATWSGPPEGSDLGSVIAVEVSDVANTAYAIAGIKLFKTEDGGATWDLVTGSSGDPYAGDFNQTLHYSNGTLLVPVRDGTLDVSTNEGATFTNVDVDGLSSIGEFAAAGDGSAYYLLGYDASDNRTLYQSTDNGATWTDTGQTGSWQSVGVDPTDPDVIVLAGSGSIDMTTAGPGGAWSEINDSAGSGSDIAFAGSRLYVGRDYTDDGGANWGDLVLEGTTNDSSLRGNVLCIDQSDTDKMWTNSGQGVARTADGGTTWADGVEGMLGITINGIGQSTNKETVWVAAQGGFGVTTNFLADEPTWDFPIVPHENVMNGDVVWVKPGEKDTVLAGTGGTIYRTTDGGSTWTDVYNYGTGIADIVANDAGTVVYAGFSDDSGSGAVVKSTDYGATWTSLGGPNASINAIAVLGGGKLLAGVGEENDSSAASRGLYKYNGSSWSQLSGASGQMVNDILIANDSIFVAGGETNDSGVFRSNDDGATWTDVTGNGLASDGWYHALASESRISKRANNVVYVSTARPAGTGKVYKTTDNGKTWSEYYTGLIDETFNALMFDGLLSGTNTGFYSMTSNAKITFKTDKTRVKAGNRVRLTARLKDSATLDGIPNKWVRLFKRAKKSAKWKFVRKKRTNDNGKKVFKVRPKKRMYYQVRWKPRGAVAESYGSAKVKSRSRRIRMRK